MAKRKYFEDHGDHIRTVMEPEAFVKEVLPSVSNWLPCAEAKAPITGKPKTNMLALCDRNTDVSFWGLIACSPKQNRFVSAYPVAKGNIVEATVTDVYEWKNGYEAYVWVEVCDEFEFAFFATDYFCNKEKYQKGVRLSLMVAAMGVEIMPGHEDITLEPEEAMKFYEHMEDGPSLDENGNIVPLVMSCSEFVGLLPALDDCPDVMQFHSPVRSIETLNLYGKEFIKVGIVISHEPNDVEVPLYFDKELCTDIVGKETIMGALWIQGRVAK